MSKEFNKKDIFQFGLIAGIVSGVIGVGYFASKNEKVKNVTKKGIDYGKKGSSVLKNGTEKILDKLSKKDTSDSDSKCNYDPTTGICSDINCVRSCFNNEALGDFDDSFLDAEIEIEPEIEPKNSKKVNKNVSINSGDLK